MIEKFNSEATLSSTPLDMDHIAHELQENIAQTAASVKLLVNSVAREAPDHNDKLAMIEQYMSILMQDIRTLTAYVACHCG